MMSTRNRSPPPPPEPVSEPHTMLSQTCGKKSLNPRLLSSLLRPRVGARGRSGVGPVPHPRPAPAALTGQQKHLLPGLVCPVASQGREAGAGIGERGLRGGVGDSVTAQLQVGPIEQISPRFLILLIVHVEALGRGAPWGALRKDAVTRLIEGEFSGVRACAQELIRDDVGREEPLGGETFIHLLFILVPCESRPCGIAVYEGDRWLTLRCSPVWAPGLPVGVGAGTQGGWQQRPELGRSQRQVSAQGEDTDHHVVVCPPAWTISCREIGLNRVPSKLMPALNLIRM